MTDQLEFVVYSKTGEFRRQFVADGSLDLVARGIHTSAFVLDDDDPAVADLAEPGARCAVWFRGAERSRGVAVERAGEGPEGTVTYTLEDDVRLMWLWQGWPTPASPIGSQTSEYAKYTGTSEAVVKAAVAAAAARLGAGWTVVPSISRGQSATVRFRFDPLADKLVTLLERDHLLPVLTYDSGRRFDVREADLIAGALTPDSGVLDSYGFSIAAPTVTRVVVAGAGEGVARWFRTVIDTAREAEWGFIAEGFVDAGNTTDADEMDAAGWDALRDGGPQTGLDATLVETDRLWFGQSENPEALTYELGDRVRFLVGEVDTTQPIAAISVTSTAEGGVLVEPRIGQIELDTESRLAKQIATLARGLREQRRRR